MGEIKHDKSSEYSRVLFYLQCVLILHLVRHLSQKLKEDVCAQSKVFLEFAVTNSIYLTVQIVFLLLKMVNVCSYSIPYIISVVLFYIHNTNPLNYANSLYSFRIE